MAKNYPGPYQVRLTYTVTPVGEVALQHVLQWNCALEGDPAVGTNFNIIPVHRRIGADTMLDSVIDNLVTVLRPMYAAATTTFTHADLWKFANLSFDASYVSTYDISLAATGAGTDIESSEQIYTYRSQEGGVMKVHLMEGENVAGGPLDYGDMNAATQNFTDWWKDDATSWALARDTSYPVAFMRMFPGQSEALFKKRHRP